MNHCLTRSMTQPEEVFGGDEIIEDRCAVARLMQRCCCDVDYRQRQCVCVIADKHLCFNLKTRQSLAGFVVAVVDGSFKNDSRNAQFKVVFTTVA